MNESTKTALTTAVAAGYVLGRTRKGKLALTVASVVVGRRLILSPQDLLIRGVRTLRDSPRFGQLSEQVRDQLLHSGRSALTTAADSKLDSLTDALQQRTRTLTGDGGAKDPSADEEHEQQAPPKRARKPSTRTSRRR